VEAAERIFTDLADPQTVARAQDDGWKDGFWRTLEESCLTLAWVPDALGGAGVSLAEGFEIVRAAGEFALAIPLAETMLAGWLLSRAGIASPAGAMTVAPAQPSDRISVEADGSLSGSACAISFARHAAHFAVLGTSPDGDLIMLVDAKDCHLFAGANLAGDSQDDIFFDGVTPVASARVPAGFDQRALMLMGGVVRSLQVAGALQSMLNRTVGYAGERIAFGKPIAKFQAVQTNVARLAGEVAAARAAAESAADALASAAEWDDGVFLEAAAAKIRCAEAASAGAALAHQVHGAIGLTVEHALHRFTLRVLAWSEDFGNDSYWAVVLGNRIASRGADLLWPLVASR
jgi:acyl-CoA dehydrogenase